jgi:tight adherence protein B
MSAAALALALAVLVAPADPRRRLIALHRPPTRPPRVLVSVMTAVVLAVAATLLPLPVVIAVSLVVATVLLRRRGRRRDQQRCAEAVTLQGALEVLVGELRVGAHPVAAFDVAAREAGGPVGAALHEVASRARLGADVPDGLRSAAIRSALPAYWERIAICWELAQSHGLAIGALMRTAQLDIAARQRYSSRVKAGMSGARTTASVLAGLPALGVGLGQLIGAQPLAFLLSGGAGGWLLVIGLTLACVGLLWSDRITSGVSA